MQRRRRDRFDVVVDAGHDPIVIDARGAVCHATDLPCIRGG
jgi:hypothetical protein